MAGLAGYVENGCISDAGIERACDTLLEFRNTLHLLGITDRIYAFATASLRNIVNSDEASARITAATGFDIDIITGEQEAILGYTGVMRELHVSDGVFTDIGGASTEITFFRDGSVLEPRSYRMGSLKLYKDCVKHILPGKVSEGAHQPGDSRGVRKETAGSAGTVHEADMHGRNGEICVQIRQISRADTGIFEYDVGKGSSEDRRVPDRGQA